MLGKFFYGLMIFVATIGTANAECETMSGFGVTQGTFWCASNEDQGIDTGTYRFTYRPAGYQSCDSDGCREECDLFMSKHGGADQAVDLEYLGSAFNIRTVENHSFNIIRYGYDEPYGYSIETYDSTCNLAERNPGYTEEYLGESKPQWQEEQIACHNDPSQCQYTDEGNGEY
jgi:hypothetical protein